MTSERMRCLAARCADASFFVCLFLRLALPHMDLFKYPFASPTTLRKRKNKKQQRKEKNPTENVGILIRNFFYS